MIDGDQFVADLQSGGLLSEAREFFTADAYVVIADPSPYPGAAAYGPYASIADAQRVYDRIITELSETDDPPALRVLPIFYQEA